MVNEEEKPYRRRNKWTKEAYKELKRQRKDERKILYFSENWSMKMMNRINVATLQKSRL